MTIRECFQQFMSTAILSLFFGNVMGSWLVIRAYKEIPFFMYFMIMVTLFICLLSLTIVLTILMKYSLSTDMLAWLIRKDAHMLQVKNQKLTLWRQTLIMKKETCTQITAQIHCIPFIVMNRQFCKDTLKNLISRIFDVILIF